MYPFIFTYKRAVQKVSENQPSKQLYPHIFALSFTRSIGISLTISFNT